MPFPQMTKNAFTDKNILSNYFDLPQGDAIQCMYVWIDGSGEGLRGKTRTLYTEPQGHADCPEWNFDGSSTGQAEGSNSDVYIRPVAMYRDPFRGGKNKIVLCETFNYRKEPAATNKRVGCRRLMEQDVVKAAVPIFGFEQEYTLLDQDLHPFGWPKNGYPGHHGFYHSAVGADKVYGRAILEAHYRACLYAGVSIVGSNPEAMPAQLEYQIGELDGLTLGDEVWMARYLLHRVAEDFGIVVSFDPKPVMGDWAGTGGHMNFSTQAMREKGGLEHINEAVKRLAKNHSTHLHWYDAHGGIDNERRLTGYHETSKASEFTYGVGDRMASVRIPRHNYDADQGYLEDRRPAANCDPYAVTVRLVKTIILEEYE